MKGSATRSIEEIGISVLLDHRIQSAIRRLLMAEPEPGAMLPLDAIEAAADRADVQGHHPVPAGWPMPSALFVLWEVSTEPYGADNVVDERGNNDGWACAKPIYVVTHDDGSPFQIYNFLDNRF